MQTTELPPLTSMEFRLLNSADRAGSVAMPLGQLSEKAFNAVLERGEAEYDRESRLYLMTDKGRERLREYRRKMEAMIQSGSVK